jgi:hypothetical protein
VEDRDQGLTAMKGHQKGHSDGEVGINDEKKGAEWGLAGKLEQ